jgi:hypothetical protein
MVTFSRPAFQKAIKDKIEKRYGSKFWLVVYLNMNEFGIRQRETAQAIAHIKQSAANASMQLFVISKKQTALNAGDGRPDSPSRFTPLVLAAFAAELLDRAHPA